MFQVVIREFQPYLKEVENVCQGSFNGVSRVFQERFKGVSSKIEGHYK